MSVEAWTIFANNCYLNVYDGGSASIIRIPYVMNDVKFSGLREICNERVDATIRGAFYGTAWGGPTFPTVTLTEKLTQLVATAAPGPLGDFLGHRGAYASNVSTFGVGFPYAVHMEFVTKGSALGKSDRTLKLWHVQFDEGDLQQADPVTRAWTGRVMGVTGVYAGSVGSAGTVASVDGAIYSRRIDQDGN
jgi:hypothetical protein